LCLRAGGGASFMRKTAQIKRMTMSIWDAGPDGSVTMRGRNAETFRLLLEALTGARLGRALEPVGGAAADLLTAERLPFAALCELVSAKSAGAALGAAAVRFLVEQHLPYGPAAVLVDDIGGDVRRAFACAFVESALVVRDRLVVGAGLAGARWLLPALTERLGTPAAFVEAQAAGGALLARGLIAALGVPPYTDRAEWVCVPLRVDGTWVLLAYALRVDAFFLVDPVATGRAARAEAVAGGAVERLVAARVVPAAARDRFYARADATVGGCDAWASGAAVAAVFSRLSAGGDDRGAPEERVCMQLARGLDAVPAGRAAAEECMAGACDRWLGWVNTVRGRFSLPVAGGGS